MLTHLSGSTLALVAFTVAIIAGLSADNPAMTTLSRALIAGAMCYPVGYVLGALGHRAIHEHVIQYIAEHPIDPPPQESDAEESAREESETSGRIDSPENRTQRSPRTGVAA